MPEKSPVIRLRGLSDALDGHVTAQALGKYERGEMMPSSGILIRLTKILSVSLEYLLSEEVEELEVGGVPETFRHVGSAKERGCRLK